jgi:hypothetical protein
MDFSDSKYFGTIPLPSSLSKILTLAQNHAGDRPNVHLWRGQSDISWPIHSSAYRRLERTSPVTEKRMKDYESYLLNHATHQGYRYEQGRELSDFELLAKLQHHGAATRLVDCSRNVLVSLWFVCNSEPDKLGLLFGVHSHHVGGGENRPKKDNYLNAIKSIEKYKHPQTWQPPVVSKRISAQSAQFLYSSVSQNLIGSLAIGDDPESYLAIGITPDMKDKLLTELAGVFDIRHLTLFPDIDGFGFANSFNFDQYESERW